MLKVAIIVLADTETHGDMGRVTNALTAAQEFKEAGDDVKLLFDGAGTKWVAELSKEDQLLNPLFNSVKDKVAGVCLFCSGAFGVKEEIERGDARLAGSITGTQVLGNWRPTVTR